MRDVTLTPISVEPASAAALVDEALLLPPAIPPSHEAVACVVTALSHALAHSPAVQADAELPAWLRRLARACRAEAVWIAALSTEAAGRAVMAYKWTSGGVGGAALPEPQEELPELPWMTARLKAGQPAAFRSAAELGADLSWDRGALAAMGLQSVLCVPLSLERSICGALFLATCQHEQVWPAEVIQTVWPLREILGGPLARWRAAHRPESRLSLERLIGAIGGQLGAAPPGKTAMAVSRALAQVAQFALADRCALFEMAKDGDGLVPTYRYEATEASRWDPTAVAAEFQWMTARVQENVAVVCPCAEDLPAQAETDRRKWQQHGIRAAMMLPIVIGARRRYALGLWWLRSDGRRWPARLPEQVRAAAQLVVSAVERCHHDLELGQARDEVKGLRDSIERRGSEGGACTEARVPAASSAPMKVPIVGSSPCLMKTMREAERVAATDSTVLILGETGTGKELLAKHIHGLSGRRGKPFVTMNVAAIPATLLESELFGREKGAYTGALTRQAGRFELAEGGTLFLDEIGELPLETQAKLLRVLQSGEFERLGGGRSMRANVRVLAATNRQLPELIKAGSFRQDLFYRLNVFPITLPPLRERGSDISQLVWVFVQELAQKIGKPVQSIRNDDLEALREYDWPGNVRELRNVVEHSMILSEEPELRLNVPDAPAGGEARPGSMMLASVEREHVERVLRSAGGRIYGAGGAAQTLGLKPTTLYSLMKRLKIERRPPRR